MNEKLGLACEDNSNQAFKNKKLFKGVDNSGFF